MTFSKLALLVAILPASLLPAVSVAAPAWEAPWANTANPVGDRARTQSDWANEFGFFADQMRDKFPETFASAGVGNDGTPFIRFTQDIPEEAREFASKLSVRVLFEQHSGRPEFEVREMVPTVHYEALNTARQSGIADTSEISTGYSDGEDVVRVVVPQDISDDLAASMERDAQDAVASKAG